MKISLLSIGNELLSGKTLNTNSRWISKKLSSIGCLIQNHITVKDNKDSIVSGLSFCLNKDPDILILTGGLGPTDDDITREVLFDYFQTDSIFDEEYWLLLKEKYRNAGLKISKSNKNQALIPKEGEILPNSKGSARGLKFIKNNTTVFALPGVPAEMKNMVSRSIVPQISKDIKKPIFSRNIRTMGITESHIFDTVKNFTNTNSNLIGYYPSIYGVDIYISNDDRKEINILADYIYKNLGDYIYSEDETDMEEIIINKAIERKKTLSIAESCTGGLIGDRITNVSQCSKAFKGGVVVYSDFSKINILGVDSNRIAKFGAVSKEIAIQMAENVKIKFGTSYGLSVTGIAGPTGGTKEKPVGLVYIGLASTKNTIVGKYNFGKDRQSNKIKTSQAALNMIRKDLFNE